MLIRGNSSHLEVLIAIQGIYVLMEVAVQQDAMATQLLS